MKKNSDTITIGVIGGLIASVVMMTFDWVINLIGLHFTPPWVVSGHILLNTDVLSTTMGILLGFSIMFMLGAGFGVIVAVIIRLTGKDYYLIKGLGIGFLFFIGNTGMMQNVAEIVPWMRSEITSTIMALLNFIILGSVSSLIIAKYSVFNIGVR